MPGCFPLVTIKIQLTDIISCLQLSENYFIRNKRINHVYIEDPDIAVKNDFKTSSFQPPARSYFLR